MSDPGPVQQVRFCEAPDGARIAYAISGTGPPMLVSTCWLSHLQHDWAAPDRGRAGSEPRVGRLVPPPPSPEIDELSAHLVWHRTGDRLELRPRDHLDRVVPGVVDAEPEAVGRAHDPLPCLQVAVMCARPTRLTHLGASVGSIRIDVNGHPVHELSISC